MIMTLCKEYYSQLYIAMRFLTVIQYFLTVKLVCICVFIFIVSAISPYTTGLGAL